MYTPPTPLSMITSLVLPIFTTIYGSLSTISHGMPRLGPTMSSIGGERDHERNSDGNNNASQMRIQLADMNAEELQQAAMQGRQTILLWIVLGCYHSIATVCSLVPFAGMNAPPPPSPHPHPHSLSHLIRPLPFPLPDLNSTLAHPDTRHSYLLSYNRVYID